MSVESSKHLFFVDVQTHDESIKNNKVMLISLSLSRKLALRPASVVLLKKFAFRPVVTENLEGNTVSIHGVFFDTLKEELQSKAAIEALHEIAILSKVEFLCTQDKEKQTTDTYFYSHSHLIEKLKKEMADKPFSDNEYIPIYEPENLEFIREKKGERCYQLAPDCEMTLSTCPFEDPAISWIRSSKARLEFQILDISLLWKGSWDSIFRTLSANCKYFFASTIEEKMVLHEHQAWKIGKRFKICDEGEAIEIELASITDCRGAPFDMVVHDGTPFLMIGKIDLRVKQRKQLSFAMSVQKRGLVLDKRLLLQLEPVFWACKPRRLPGHILITGSGKNEIVNLLLTNVEFKSQLLLCLQPGDLSTNGVLDAKALQYLPLATRIVYLPNIDYALGDSDACNLFLAQLKAALKRRDIAFIVTAKWAPVELSESFLYHLEIEKPTRAMLEEFFKGKVGPDEEFAKELARHSEGLSFRQISNILSHFPKVQWSEQLEVIKNKSFPVPEFYS